MTIEEVWNQAADLASYWHGGQWSELYSFASTGSVQDAGRCLREIRCTVGELNRETCLTEEEYQKDAEELEFLLDFFRDIVAEQSHETEICSGEY